MASTRETVSDLAKNQQVSGDQHPNDSVFGLRAGLGLQSSPADLQTTEDAADHSDGGYGWVCVATCFTVNCFTWGVVAVSLAVYSGEHLD